MGRIRSSVATLFLLTCVAASTAAAGTPQSEATADTPCWASHCVPGAWSGANQAIGVTSTGYQAAQVFVPSFSGVLEYVHLGLSSNSASQVVVQIRSAHQGSPTWVVYGSTTVPGAPYYEYGLHTASFAGQNVVLQAGTEYAIVLHADSPTAVQVLASAPTCDPQTPGSGTGSGPLLGSSDSGGTWSGLVSPRTLIYRACVTGVTPAAASTWGSLKLHYR